MICVLGMHRGGTSAIAGAIQALGVHLGPEPHRMKPRVDNPQGFFEHQLLTDLNDEILRTLGGSWHEPPPLPAGWETTATLQDIRRRAERLLQEDFGSTPLWGWKDPRTCLTLPFWQPLLPPARYVICLRNPIDVARSLHVRDSFPLEKGIDLWLRHMASAVSHRSGSPTLFVAYDDFVDQRATEIERLSAFVGRPTPGSGRSNAGADQGVDDNLRHYKSALADLFASRDASYAACAFYVVLRSLVVLQRANGLDGAELESVGTLVARSSERAHDDERAARRLANEVADLHQTLAVRSAEVDRAMQDLQSLRAAAAASLATERAAADRSLAIERDARVEAQRDADRLRSELADTTAVLLTVRRAADQDRAALAVEITKRDDARLGAERAAQAEQVALRHQIDRHEAALADAHTHARQLHAALAASEAEHSRLNALLQHLQTPVGTMKLVLRACLPASVHSVLRRWAGH